MTLLNKMLNILKIKHTKNVLNIALFKGFITKKNAIKLLNISKYGFLTCEICKEAINKNNRNRVLSYDHILPRAKGGTNEFNNLQITHKICNHNKGDK